MLISLLTLLSCLSVANTLLIGDWECKTFWQGQNGESGLMIEKFSFMDAGQLKATMDYSFSYPDGLKVNVSFLGSGEWLIDSENILTTRYHHIEAVKSTDDFLGDDATEKRVIAAHFKDGSNRYSIKVSDSALTLITTKRKSPIECRR